MSSICMPKKGIMRRLLAWLLTIATVLALVPVSLPADAASYLDPYLNKMVEWGFLRGDIDGNLRAQSNITRAEFVTIINRAFGYTKTGSTPFTDVKAKDWYAEDVAIAYNVGYIQGTSKNTFSPQRQITREEASVILARNLMLQASTGENTDFTDSRDISTWSRGLITALVDQEIINGYNDGTFRPQNPITRGETAILVVRAIGTPVQTAGVHSLGNVYGNVTITTSGVTLRNTVIAGNLYVTAGVELGNVLLENVTVLGEIVVSGGGVSESGQDSVVLRNVTSPKLVLDNIKNSEVSVRIEGDGKIDVASVRTNAFLEDNTPAGSGALRIELNGEAGTALELAGNIKDVVNLTSKSYLSLGAGQAQSITVDETATGSTLNIVAGAQVDEVNLDVGATVTGDGDIGSLTVNADGSTVSMLPDQITIRPGVIATIDGEKMDSAAAAESSADPRMLAGYPQITDLAPTTATAQFTANKKGTLYWAVTSVTDGSVGADDLINPPSYSTKILKRGTVSITGSGKVATAKISGLTAGGAYYLSSVFVDGREDRSTVKVISFTTPDNTTPAFASGYPYLSRITNISAQVAVMATKTCRLYYAVLPKGAAAPTGDDFKANAVTGNLGYGSLDVTKNKTYTFDVNSVPLDELASYDLYLWLTDIEGGSSSAVKKLSFTTVDGTPPEFRTKPTINSVKETAVGLYANLNEAGTLYWVVVKEGEVYPKPMANEPGAVDWSSLTAKIQVSSGMNALKSGKVSMTEGKDVSFTVSGLDKESAYDLYYVAQDKAGNYSESIGKITIHTLDNTAPTVKQSFTKYNGEDTTAPLPNTDIWLEFSEAIQYVPNNVSLLELYQQVTASTGDAQQKAREQLGLALRSSIKLYVDPTMGVPELVEDAADLKTLDEKNTKSWTIDYRYAEVELKDGKLLVKFPTKTDKSVSALNLSSGAEYYFEIESGTLSDTSEARNTMGQTRLDPFKTVFSIVYLSNPNISSLDLKDKNDKANRVDMSWSLRPLTTENAQGDINWDMLLWSDTSVTFELYTRSKVEGGDWTEWKLVNDKVPTYSIMASETATGEVERGGASLTRHFLRPSNNPTFDALSSLKENTEYQYAIHFTQVGTLTDSDTWNQRINLEINIVAGATDALQALANGMSDANFDSMVGKSITNIGQPDDFTLIKRFSDQIYPTFTSSHPTFDSGSSAINMKLMLSRPGTIYYVVAPKGTIPTTDGTVDYTKNGTVGNSKDGYEDLPKEGVYDSENQFTYDITLTSPAKLDIINASSTYGGNSRIKYGVISGGPSQIEKLVEGLEPKVDGVDGSGDYIVYFVIRGTSNQVYSPVYAYQVQTTNVDIPYITMEATNPEVNFTTTEDAKLDYILIAENQLPDVFDEEMKGDNITDAPSGDSTLTGITSVTGTGTMTVLEAILQTYDKKKQTSYFDAFAAQDLKDEVQEIIQRRAVGTGGGTPVASGKLETTQNVIQQVDFRNVIEEMENDTYLYCLATAQHALGSAYSFKGVENVHIRDTEPPYLISVATAITGSTGTDVKLYSGTLTLVFNEPLYYMDYLPNQSGGDTSTLRPVVNGKNSSSEKKYITLLDIASNPAGFSCLAAGTTATTTFTLKFDKIPINTTISFPSAGVLSDRALASTKEQFVLQLQPGGGVGGFLAAEFKVINGRYEGK